MFCSIVVLYGINCIVHAQNKYASEFNDHEVFYSFLAAN